MAKKRVGKFPKAFRQYAVARLKQCDNIIELAKEVGVHRRLLYTWRDQLEPAEGGEGPPRNSREAMLRKEVSRLKRALADKTLEADFFAGALHTVQAPGLVHHSDRGIQYASGAYVQLLRQQHMIPSMSRPVNPYDNASCESFLKTLKREEICATAYQDLDHLRTNIAAFIDQYYNRIRLHSALGYRPPDEFERGLTSDSPPGATSLQFFRPAEE